MVPEIGYNKLSHCNFIISDLNVIETVLIKRHRLVVYLRKLWMCLSNKCLKVSEFNITSFEVKHVQTSKTIRIPVPSKVIRCISIV